VLIFQFRNSPIKEELLPNYQKFDRSSSFFATTNDTFLAADFKRPIHLLNEDQAYHPMR
jgi:hypothetical protein